MNQFLPEDLISFLQVTDNYLTKRCDLIIIGGAAASLAYGVTRTTSDIDSISQIPDHLANALDLANAKTGFSIPVSYVGVFEPPYDYKVRLSPIEKVLSGYIGNSLRMPGLPFSMSQRAVDGTFLTPQTAT